MKKLNNKQSGFTIIEVVLVLAIAGLIFLVVFLALPQLQKSQRDSQRRADAGRFLTALETAASNNNGTYPTSAQATDTTGAGFLANYLRNDGAVFADPSGTDYVVTVFADGADPTIAEPTGQVHYATSAQCGSAEGTFDDATGTRKVAAIIALENGIAYCQDNR